MSERIRQPDQRVDDILASLGQRSIVLVGIMGSGKTSAGRRLAIRLGLPFVDSDVEIEAAHKLTIAEIFSTYGEPYFRDGERRVVARLLNKGPSVIATGGGAYMNDQTRENIARQGISIWLNAEFELLMRRVRKRPTRPLLRTPDPEQTMRQLMAGRYPVYAKADITIEARDAHFDDIIDDLVNSLHCYLCDSGLPLDRSGPDGVLSSSSTHSHEPSSVPSESSRSRHLTVELDDRSYTIVLGPDLIAEAGSSVVRLAGQARKPACAIVTDKNVASLHLSRLEKSFEEAGLRFVSIVLPPGEATKSYQYFEQVCEAVIAAKIERGDCIVAFGGGVIGDLAGFAAASVRRGVRFVQMPTSLLAQVDSSVGGKTGINSPQGKNLIGAFYQPALVLADSSVLETLPEREFRAGYAEIVKYGLINDAPTFAWLESQWRDIFSGGPQRIEAIAKSCIAKAAVVSRDETEQGDRALLNLGHTFGHALERLTGYDSARLVHGEGVAIGLACAFRFSTQLGLCPGQDSERVAAHLRTVGLPTRIGDIRSWDAGPDAIIEAMYQDKKVQGGALTFILARGIGQSFIAKNVEPAAVRAYLLDELSRS